MSRNIKESEVCRIEYPEVMKKKKIYFHGVNEMCTSRFLLWSRICQTELN